MADRYNLTAQAARRTAEAVRKVLNPPVDTSSIPRRRRTVPHYKRWFRIVTNEGAGDYTVRLQEWDKSAGELADVSDQDHPEYNKNQDAFDSHGRPFGVINDIVEGWMIYVDDEWIIIINLGGEVRHGKITTTWEDGNTSAVHPCDDAGSNVVSGVTMTLYVTIPKDNEPTGISLAENDVIAYQPFYDTEEEEWRGVIVGMAGGGLPEGTNKGDLLYWDAEESIWKILAVPASPAVLAWDGTSGLHWLTIDSPYKFPQRSNADTIVADYLRFPN